MDGMMGVVKYGIGTILGFALVAWLVVAIIQDVTQKKHTVLRNYPVIGRLRFFFEDLGEYFRQYFFAGDRSEMPFNRATPRIFVYRLAKNEGSIIGFGFTNDLREAGLHRLREPRLPGAGGGASADAAAYDRRRILPGAVRGHPLST